MTFYGVADAHAPFPIVGAENRVEVVASLFGAVEAYGLGRRSGHDPYPSGRHDPGHDLDQSHLACLVHVPDQQIMGAHHYLRASVRHHDLVPLHLAHAEVVKGRTTSNRCQHQDQPRL